MKLLKGIHFELTRRRFGRLLNSYSQASNQNVGFLGGNNNSSGGSVAEGEGRWMRPTSTTSPGSLLNKCNTPSPRGTPPPSVDAVSPPSVARELPIHKSWSMGDSWERGRVDRFAGFMAKTSSLQRDLVDKTSVGEHSFGKEKEKSDGKAMLEDMEVQASAAAGQAMSKRRICREGSKSGENCLKKNVDNASNSKDGTNHTVEEENLEVPGPERVSCAQNDWEVKVKRLLEELTQLSMDMEEEKEKSRRLHQENESLDIELELINQKLK